MNPNGYQELNKLVGSMWGLRCWYVSCGGAAGSSFQLALGNKVPRRLPLTNPTHTEEYRCFEGEANFVVWCCWRLDGPERPLTSWDDSIETIEKELAKLVGSHIESVSMRPPAWDLTIAFSNGLHLHVFCDHVPGDPSFAGNWELWNEKVAVFIGPGTRQVLEAREDVGAVGQRPPT